MSDTRDRIHIEIGDLRQRADELERQVSIPEGQEPFFWDICGTTIYNTAVLGPVPQ